MDEIEDVQDADAEEGAIKLPVSQNPGDFIIFWNVLVPLSVLFNIRRFGLRVHELGLIIALMLNPFIVNYLIKRPILAWIVSVFLIIWVERILARWPWYRICTFCFLRNIILFAVFLTIPGIVIKYIWHPFYQSVPYALLRLNARMTDETIDLYRNSLAMILAGALLVHAIYTYSVYDGVSISFRGRGGQNSCGPTFFKPVSYRKQKNKKRRKRTSISSGKCPLD